MPLSRRLSLVRLPRSRRRRCPRSQTWTMKTVRSLSSPSVSRSHTSSETFRTRLVAAWMLSNATLAIAIENLNGLESSSEAVNEADLMKKQNVYFAIILYSTFGLALVRFTGVCFRCSLSLPKCLSRGPQCLFYFFKRNLFRCCRRN
jgi:hypothetical protein